MLPEGANIVVNDGDEIDAGDVIAKMPRETTKTKDITGGLPRVAELFEARKPKEHAVISEIDGVVAFGKDTKGKRKVVITPEVDGELRPDLAKEYLIAKGKHISVHAGDRVRAGEALMDGAANPHDILKVLGEKELARYLVDEVQEVYRLQGVKINDKHIETIVRQMLRRVRVIDVGDTNFLVDEQVEKFVFEEENEKVMAAGGQPGRGRAAAARHHQGVALHRVVHLGVVVPGDDEGAHRGRHQRQGRLPPRPQGERHHGPAHPRRHRKGLAKVVPHQRRRHGDQERQQGRSGSRPAPRRAASRGQLVGRRSASRALRARPARCSRTWRRAAPAREAEELLGQINPDATPGEPEVKELGRKATQAGSEVSKRLDGLQTQVVEAVGVASQAQVKELNRELGKLCPRSWTRSCRPGEEGTAGPQPRAAP